MGTEQKSVALLHAILIAILSTLGVSSWVHAEKESPNPIPSPLFEIVGEWKELKGNHPNLTVRKDLSTTTRVVSGTLVWEPSQQAYFLYDKATADLGGTVYTWLVLGRVIQTYKDHGDTEYVKNLARLSFDPAGRLHVHTVSRKGYKDEPKVDEYIFELSEATLKQREKARLEEEIRIAKEAAERIRQQELGRKIEANRQIVQQSTQKNLSELLVAYKDGTLGQRTDLKSVSYSAPRLRDELLTILKKELDGSPETPPALFLTLLEWLDHLQVLEVNEKSGDIQAKDLRLAELLGKDASISSWAISSSDAWHKLLTSLSPASKYSLREIYQLATRIGFKKLVSEKESDSDRTNYARAIDRLKKLISEQLLQGNTKTEQELFGLPSFSSGITYVLFESRSAYSAASYTRLESSLTFLQAAALEPAFPLELLETIIASTVSADGEVSSREVLNSKATLSELTASYSRMFRQICAPENAPKHLAARASKLFEKYSNAMDHKLKLLEGGRGSSSKRLSFMRENTKCEFRVLSDEKLAEHTGVPAVSNIVYLLPQFVSSKGTDTYQN